MAQRKLLKWGIWGGVLGTVVGLMYSPALSASPVEGEAMWMFAVDHCEQDYVEPQIQQVRGAPEGEERNWEKECDRKRSYEVYSDYGIGRWWKGRPVSQGSESGGDAPPLAMPNLEGVVFEETSDISGLYSEMLDVSIQGAKQAGVIQFQYRRGGNCCSEIELLPSRQGQVLEIREQDRAGGCRCRCVFSTEGVIRDLEPGQYTLRVFGKDRSGDEVMLFEGMVDLAAE